MNDAVQATIPSNASPLSFAFDSGFNSLFVPSSSAGFAQLVDTPSNQVPVVIPLPGPSTAIAIDSQNHLLFAALPAEKILKVVDMSGVPFTFRPDVPLSDTPTALALDPGGTLLYIALSNGNLEEMDTASGTVFTPQKVGNRISQIELTTSGDQVWPTGSWLQPISD